MKKILLATDGSPSAEGAAELAIELCRDTGARLEVLTVRTLPAHGDPGAPGGDHMDVQPNVEGIAADAARMASGRGVDAHASTAYGAPAAAIAEAAEALGVDLIVVGSHGHGRVGSAVLGSVSLALLSDTHTPVTIVHAARAARSAAVASASDR